MLDKDGEAEIKTMEEVWIGKDISRHIIEADLIDFVLLCSYCLLVLAQMPYRDKDKEEESISVSPCTPLFA